MKIDDALCLATHGQSISPATPALSVQVSIAGADFRGIHTVHQGQDACFDNALVAADTRCLQPLIHHGTQTTQHHALKRAGLFDEFVKAVRRFVLLARIVEIQFVVLVKGVVEIASGIDPVSAPGKINIPRERGPFTGAFTVAVKVVILVPMVLTAAQGQSDKVTDRLGKIQDIPGISSTLGQGTTFTQKVHQVLEILCVFPSPGLFFISAGPPQVVVHLVEGSLRIQPQPLQPAVIGVLHHVRDAEKGSIALNPYGKTKMAMAPSLLDHLIGKGVSNP